jgi:hypothetical protein
MSFVNSITPGPQYMRGQCAIERVEPVHIAGSTRLMAIRLRIAYPRRHEAHASDARAEHVHARTNHP